MAPSGERSERMTDSQRNYDEVEIGHDIGTLEIVLDQQTVAERIALVRWADERPVQQGLAPPGITISQHSRMKFDALPQLRVSIWSRSEHEFLRPFKVGETVTVSGRVVEKYAKRGRNYMVTELETRNQAGEVLLRSRETGVWVE
jgi:hypothetical protein